MVVNLEALEPSNTSFCILLSCYLWTKITDLYFVSFHYVVKYVLHVVALKQLNLR